MFNSMVFRCLMLSFYLLSVLLPVGGFATVHYCGVLPPLIKVSFFLVYICIPFVPLFMSVAFFTPIFLPLM
jgi:hypothetical protein